MITRIEYANDDHTRTAVVFHLGRLGRLQHRGRWGVSLGDRARAAAQTIYADTMTKAQGYARIWVDGGQP
jgi:hypothetical protein